MNHNDNDILLDPDGTVRAGTLAALVERLCSQPDTPYSNVFLITFKSFITADELFDLLVVQFRNKFPQNATCPKILAEWQKSNQICVLNILRAMVTDDGILDMEDMDLLDHMLEFLKSDEVCHLDTAIELIKNIERIKACSDPLRQARAHLLLRTTFKTSKKLALLDIEPLELARQLTVKESELFRRIKPIECLLRAQGQKTNWTDTIATVIQTSNRIVDWVADSILSQEDARKRAKVVKYLVMVADLYRTLKNFSTMTAITTGLDTPPIRRLQRSWDQVDHHTLSQFAAYKAAIDCEGQFKEYRRMMQTINSPCVPFIGVYLLDLQFIHDNNVDTLPDGLINFHKRQMLSEVIGNIKR